MKVKGWWVLTLFVVLALLQSSASVAQQPQPQVSGDRPARAEFPPSWGPEFGKFPIGPGRWSGSEGISLSGPAAEEGGMTAAAVPLGQPGLSFRYVQTFGKTQEPFIETNKHFFGVEGVGTIGNFVWIADTHAHRVLKFNSNGTFQRKIGKAGVIDATDTALDRITDVAEDSSGNVWVVDAGASHVVKYNSSGEIIGELGKAWNSGSANNRFENPISIAFDSAGNIYVSDSGYWGSDYGNNRVQIFNSSGTYLATIGGQQCGTGNTQLCWPRHIAIYGNRLYVADAENHRIQIFDISNPAAPSYAATLGTTGSAGSGNNQLDTPQGVAVDANFIYVADTENHRVQVFNRNTLAYVATIGGTKGSGNNEFKYPTDVAVDAAGNIYVADYANKRVQQYNSSRVYQRTYGTTGVSYQAANDRFYYPEGVAVAPDGSIYIAEGYGYRLVKLNAAGVPQWTVGEAGQPGEDNAHFTYLMDVAVAPDGRIYTVESWGSTMRIDGNHRLQIFNPDGSYAGGFGGYGNTNDKFAAPTGIGIDHNGNIYVADRDNHRVQIYNNQLTYIATLGKTGEAGSDNAHFDGPSDVAVDRNGYIYVSDEGNDRIQVFNSNRQYVRTIGGGGSGRDFSHFDNWGPHKVAVDSQGRLYVVDTGNSRVQVFDNFANGNAYLTTIGGSGGSNSSQFSNVIGIAIGPDDSVYTTEIHNNHRIQKYAPGVPGWKQININGFGDPENGLLRSLETFQGALYATGYQPYVWRMDSNGTWTQASTRGFGDSTNVENLAMAVFNNSLYVATFTFICDDPDCDTWHTNGPQFWRTADGTTWENVTPSGSISSDYRYVSFLESIDGRLYAGLGRGDASPLGAEIWRTADGLTWQKIASDGFKNDPYNTDVLSLVSYNGRLYAGTRHGDWQNDAHTNGPLGGEVWRSDDGSTWVQVNDSGFGDVVAHRVEKLIVYNNALYAYVSRLGGTAKGAEIWRCTATICNSQSDWTKVVDNGFGNPENQYFSDGIVFNGHLYAVVENDTTGLQIWRTSNGTNWEPVVVDGLGDSNNYFYWTNKMVEHNNRLFIGTSNWANGGEVWLFLHNRLFLPLVLRN
jgi:tripartite motif-containing protein 71